MWRRSFSEECCERITHRIIFNGPASRDAANKGWAKYQLMHLSEIPDQVRHYLRPDVAMISVERAGTTAATTAWEPPSKG